jgi:hypothetical protein
MWGFDVSPKVLAIAVYHAMRRKNINPNKFSPAVGKIKFLKHMEKWVIKHKKEVTKEIKLIKIVF